MKVEEFLSKYNIPSASFVAATTEAIEQGELDPIEYRARIVELTGRGEDLTDVESRYVYLYMIQESVRDFNNLTEDDELNMAILYDVVYDKATKYIANNQYLFVNEEQTPEGKPAKRGTKKELTCELWAKHKDDGLSRQEWIAMLMDKVELTKAGSSTYYAKLKKGTFGC